MIDDSRIKDIIYKRKNGENIVNDPETVKSCKNEQSRDIINNARLGSYDKFGNYIIIPDIKRELIGIPKIVYNVKHEKDLVTYEMRGSIPIFGDLFFKLTFANEEAVLYLIETVKREANGYQETYDEVVDSCVSGKYGLPQEIIFKNYNIKESPIDLGKTLYDYSNILTRKVYLSLLSKELNKISLVDERAAFDKMVKTLKAGGEYGKKVLGEFFERLKNRPGIFEIEKSDKYNKAINEVLLSSLDIATTKEDKEDFSKRETYLQVLNARNENINEYIDEANRRIDEKYVESIVNNATNNFNAGLEPNEEESEFIDALNNKKPEQKRKLDKPILKQGKDDEEEKTDEQKKEEKIKAIISKGEKTEKKKTPANKKLKPKSSVKKKAKKKVSKGKLKKKKKKVVKAKSPQKAKAKVGGSLKSSAANKKAKKKENSTLSFLVANKFYDTPEVKEEPLFINKANNLNKEEAQKEENKQENKQEKNTSVKQIFSSLNEDIQIKDMQIKGKALDKLEVKEKVEDSGIKINNNVPTEEGIGITFNSSNNSPRNFNIGINAEENEANNAPNQNAEKINESIPISTSSIENMSITSSPEITQDNE